ncbi:rho GTPase-activating protein 45-like [Oppia nitens]|uniref:rho GTPase-activating protein 45-like n=1 Tax=Oppia nitens TaxID=1686743 RepID=UPI0023D9D636|nr:rho GTPase-activating protein 45-like [Oppia nitens]
MYLSPVPEKSTKTKSEPKQQQSQQPVVYSHVISGGSGGGGGGGGSSSGGDGPSKPFDWQKNQSSRHSKIRKGRHRKPSYCSDSETESSTGCAHAYDDLCLTVPNTKKWSLPLPAGPRGSESDSTSSSWSARSADETTEDERSPIPSPSASTQSCEALISETQSSADEIKAKWKRPKKISKAAETHKLQRMKTTNYGRCKICDTYVYFWGFQCTECQLISHKKCLKKMTIMCPKAPLPPKSNIMNMDLTLTDHEVPVLVVKCTLEIERRSCTTPGIYRMTGVASRVQKILKSFESGPHLIDVSDVTPNDLCSVLKVFLRELKNPLITNDVYKEFIDIGRVYKRDDDLQERKVDLITALRSVVGKLHNNHRQTLTYLIHHLKRITNYHEQNNMSPNSLGIIFAPTIFRPRDAINDLFTEVFEAGPQARVIELMITFVNEVFGHQSQSHKFLYEFVN